MQIVSAMHFHSGGSAGTAAMSPKPMTHVGNRAAGDHHPLGAGEASGMAAAVLRLRVLRLGGGPGC